MEMNFSCLKMAKAKSCYETEAKSNWGRFPISEIFGLGYPKFKVANETAFLGIPGKETTFQVCGELKDIDIFNNYSPKWR